MRPTSSPAAAWRARGRRRLEAHPRGRRPRSSGRGRGASSWQRSWASHGATNSLEQTWRCEAQRTQSSCCEVLFALPLSATAARVAAIAAAEMLTNNSYTRPSPAAVLPDTRWPPRCAACAEQVHLALGGPEKWSCRSRRRSRARRRSSGGARAAAAAAAARSARPPRTRSSCTSTSGSRTRRWARRACRRTTCSRCRTRRRGRTTARRAAASPTT